jgi:hypothetical protein
MSDHQEAIESATSCDGRKRWQLLRRRDGFYLYEEETFEEEIYWIDEDGGERDVAATSYWSPSYVSGLFDSNDRARADALGSLPWLRGASPGA